MPETILTIGDPHFQVSNLPIIDDYIESVLTVLKEHKVTLCVILGDLLHTHEKVHAMVQNKAIDFVQKVSSNCPTIVIVGNHDMINNSQFLTENHWMNVMKPYTGIEIVDKGLVLPTDIGDLYFCPYVYPGRFIEALNTISPDWCNARMIFAHQEINGCKSGAYEMTGGDEWKEEYPYLVSGHIHDRQRLGPNMFYPGSSMQHAFGESASKTVTVWNITQDTITHTEVSLGMRRKRIIRLDLQGIEEYVPPGNEDIRINVKATPAEIKRFKKSKKYKSLIDQKVKIMFKPITEETCTPVDNELPFDTLLRKECEKDSELSTLYKTYF